MSAFSGRQDASASPAIAPADVIRQLERILAHPLFLRSARLSAFLRYTVENTLSGEAASLKEIVIGADVFRRGASFDPQTDNLVRVTAARVRSRLAEYYHRSGSSDAVVIDIPKGRYAASFSIARAPERNAAPAASKACTRTSVGRDRELERIREAFSSASSGSGSMLAISGDAGMGKTTIVEDFLAEIETDTETAWIARGRCSERLATTDAFAPVFECLDDLTHGALAGDAIRVMGESAPTWLAQIVPAREDAAGILSKEVSSERMRREFLRLFETLSTIRPVIVFLDDLHWADASTCDLLGYLASRTKDSRILIVTTYRPSQVSASHPFLSVRLSLERSGVCHEISLELLHLDDIEAYLAIRFPTNAFPPEFVNVVHERTEGSPLFLTDMISFLLDKRVLVKEGGQWCMTRDVAEIRKVIPDSSQSLIRLQISQFGSVERRILQCAAVQGVEFDSEVICRVLSLEPVDVEERLQALESLHRFVRLIGERKCADRSVSIRYRFAHVYYQNALYADLTAARRSSLSLSAANALVSLDADNGRWSAAEIALLFECGRDDQRASEYFFRAARHAASLFAYPEAVILCERGLAALNAVPESRERDARELRFTQILGLAQMATFGFAAPEVEKTHRRSQALCLRLNEKGRLVRVLWGIHTCLVNAGALVPSLEVATEMRQLADELDDPVSLVESLHALGTTHAFMGDLTEAREALERIFEVLPLDEHKFAPRLYALDTHVTSLSMLARVLARLGLAEESMERASSSVALANRLAHPPSLTYATFWVGWTHHARGEYSDACTYLETAMSLSRKHGLPQIAEWGRVVRGSCLAHLGKAEEGVSEIRTSLDNQLAMRCLLERPFCLTLLAEALVRLGCLQEALTLCDEALRIAQETRGRSYEEETRRIRRVVLARLTGQCSNQAIV